MTRLAFALALVACSSPVKPVATAVEPATPVPMTKPPSDLARVSGDGWEPREPTAPMLVATRDAITLDGKLVVAMQDGVVSGEEREGGSLGRKIIKLTAAVAALPQPHERLGIAIDRRDSYDLLIALMYSAKVPDAKFTNFSIYADANGRSVAIPIHLPDRGSSTVIGVAPAQPSLIVSIDKTSVMVWSVDGSEGTPSAPSTQVARAAPDMAAKVNAGLGAIFTRRWTDPAAPRQIVLMASGATDLQTVALVLGAMRSFGGKPMFDDVLFASGFE